RPDNPDAGDEQTSYYESSKLVTIALGGNGSGKTFVGAQKVVRFLCEQQPPPKPNTLFWVIGPTLERTCNAAWDQKLSQIIPREWVDWDRITWENSNRNFPRAVPLKPWAGHPGRNWTIEFKSTDQGRDAMQAAAIGGAW